MMATSSEMVVSSDSQRSNDENSFAGNGDEYLIGPRCYSRFERRNGSRPRKAENILLRLMRHFSSHSSLGSSHCNQFASNGYTSLSCSGHETKHMPSSVSNGDIRHHCQSIMNGVPPAVTGIKNHGNTCFMNSILQCLSNTDLFAEYFVLNYYRNDLSRRNKLHAKKYGTKGEVTEQMAALLRSLWSNQYNSETSSKFKALVAKYGPQYEGSDQHDAQEFLLWLLDKIHEDLNIATKKKYKKFKNMYNHNRPDDVIAAETLANHMRCNSSFIHELFQAQLRSSLVCRSCGNSNTFDPYLCLSLPVPARQTHTIIVNVAYLKKSPREVKIGVSIEAQATLRELRDKISRLIKVPERQLVLSVKDDEMGIKELAKDTEVIADILDDMQEIDALETPAVYYPSHVIDTSCSASPTTQLLILLWRNSVKSLNDTTLFGPLFTCQISREANYKQIQTELLSLMKSILRKDVDMNSSFEEGSFKIRVIFTNNTEKYYLPEDVDHPLYMPAVDKALLSSENKDYRGPVHLKLLIEWNLALRDEIFLADDLLPVPVVDSNIEYVKARTQKANRASLTDCFEMYFREEKLAGENAWVCPACKRRQQCIKRLSLWSVPQVFIVHLKRFRQASTTQRNKLSTLVLFPLNGLDMNPYLVPKLKFCHNQTAKINAANGVINTLPASHRSSRYVKNEENVFDLYAVCNHNGNMQSGHYTAFCKNPVDGQWYSYDDTKVTSITEDCVITADAYILFYQRRINYSSLSSCASSSTSGYSSATSSCYCSSEHWACRLPNSSCSSPKSSHSQELLSQSL
ncbi:ubiquitin carboxyl-terminal hydrolase 31-like protein [Leptotrombidium deliense]|uniref:Ubiquitin carboxyl-terminal hydrolase n=1 Tax=Leptotrombidium deliense TaxID=299467 RepID=A0A443SNV8_9ACAR|nr:ubiquitin carboxyl-terminal hydrolase 31-like protein [Leptotrombidium deliense]